MVPLDIHVAIIMFPACLLTVWRTYRWSSSSPLREFRRDPPLDPDSDPLALPIVTFLCSTYKSNKTDETYVFNSSCTLSITVRTKALSSWCPISDSVVIAQVLGQYIAYAGCANNSLYHCFKMSNELLCLQSSNAPVHTTVAQYPRHTSIITPRVLSSSKQVRFL